MEVDEIDTGCISQIKLLAKNFKSLDEDIQKRIESNKSTKIINIFNYLETKIYIFFSHIHSTNDIQTLFSIFQSCPKLLSYSFCYSNKKQRHKIDTLSISGSGESIIGLLDGWKVVVNKHNDLVLKFLNHLRESDNSYWYSSSYKLFGFEVIVEIATERICMVNENPFILAGELIKNLYHIHKIGYYKGNHIWSIKTKKNYKIKNKEKYNYYLEIEDIMAESTGSLNFIQKTNNLWGIIITICHFNNLIRFHWSTDETLKYIEQNIVCLSPAIKYIRDIQNEHRSENESANNQIPFSIYLNLIKILYKNISPDGVYLQPVITKHILERPSKSYLSGICSFLSRSKSYYKVLYSTSLTAYSEIDQKTLFELFPNDMIKLLAEYLLYSQESNSNDLYVYCSLSKTVKNALSSEEFIHSYLNKQATNHLDFPHFVQEYLINKVYITDVLTIEERI